MRARRALSAALSLAALAGGMSLALTGPAVAQESDPAEVWPAQVGASFAALPCVPGGPTGQDGANATALNPQLTNKMRNNLNAYNMSCARAVVEAVKGRGYNQRAAAIAVSTIIVETSMANLDGGDLDSVGLFQQRESWGSFAQRTDPGYATGKFLDVMSAFYPNGSWNTAPIGDVAADVQRPHSDYRYRYGVEAADAVRIADHLWGAPPAAPAGVRSVVTTSDGSQLFGVGADGHVVSTFWSGSITTNGGWHEWFSIPTGYADGVAAANASVTFTKINGRMQLFTTAPNGYVISTFWDPAIPTNGGWREWFAIPTGYGDGRSAGVVTATTINGQPQLFTTAPDGQVISTFWSGSITSNGGWHSWFAIPTGYANGKTATNATVTATTINGQPQLFTTAPDGQVISTFWSGSITTNGGWREWFGIPTGYANGKGSANAVVTATTINGQPQLFTTAPDGQVISTFWSGSIPTNGGWREWFAIPTGYANGKAGANSAVTATVINGQPQLFTTTADGRVVSTFWSGTIPTNGGWHEWFAIPTGFGDGIASRAARVGMIMLNNQPQLFATSAGGHVMSTFWSGSIPTNGGWREWFAIPTGHGDGKLR
ncbi:MULTISPECIES: hypothetical protein [unclassified Saccharothrix]|uniref:hypothetical protein n=1 Tax=unclassified Saccharothrix TaxID=2593673 RepID=UPI00307D046E